MTTSGAPESVRTARIAYGEGRRSIIHAAIAVVADRGLAHATYRAIAAEAGVAHGTVQHHFASLDDLFEEALTACVQLSVEPLQGVTSPADFVARVIASVEAAEAVHSFQFELILESRRRQGLRPLVRRLYQRYWSTMEGALESMGFSPDERTVRAVLAAVDGLVFQLVTVASDDQRGARATTSGLLEILTNLQPRAQSVLYRENPAGTQGR